MGAIGSETRKLFNNLAAGLVDENSFDKCIQKYTKQSRREWDLRFRNRKIEITMNVNFTKKL